MKSDCNKSTLAPPAMSASFLWISTVFYLILIQGHSADADQVQDVGTGEMCMRHVEEKQSPQCGAGISADSVGEPLEIVEKPKGEDVAEENIIGTADGGDSSKDAATLEPVVAEVARRDIVEGGDQSGEIALPPPPPPPPPPRLDKLPDVEVLLEVEEAMLNYVREYVENETLRLEQLNKNLAHWMPISNYSMADPQAYLSVYLNCFHLLKRMAFDIPNEVLNYSLFDSNFREEDLDQWDIYSGDHHLVSLLNSSPQKLELLDSLDAHELLSLLNLNSDLSVPASSAVDILAKALHRPLDFEELTSEDLIVDAVLDFVLKLNQQDQGETSKLLMESAKLKYPSNEKLSTASGTMMATSA